MRTKSQTTNATPAHTFRHIYLGLTHEGTHVFAEVGITDGSDKPDTFTDHTTGTRPESVSISFYVTTVRLTMRSLPGGALIAAGQVPPEDRIIVSPATPHLDFILHMWEEWHLNTLRAACDHMTHAMLYPSDAEMSEYLAECAKAGRYTGASEIQGYRVDRVVCPETGYRYGSAWLTRKPDTEAFARLRAIITEND